MDLTAKSQETLDLIRKAQTTGINTTTGIVGVDLGDLISLMPVNTPWFNSLSRTRPEMAGPAAIWRVMTDVRNIQSRPSTALDFAAPVVQSNLITVSSPYAKIGAGYTVTQDAIDLAKGFADAHAVEVQQAMNLYKIGADRVLLHGQQFALPVPTAPTVTPATTGGSIAASTAIPVKVAARTGSNYYWGGSTVASAAGSATTAAGGSTNSATVTWPSIPGAVAYDVFVNNFYYTTVTVNTVTVTAIPTANAAVPNLPGIYSTAPSAVPTTDSSAQAADTNGLLATLAGDYATGGATGLVQRGNGTNSGAYFKSLGGSQFTVSGQNIAEIDNLNNQIFNNVQMSPTRYLVSSQEANSISKLIFANAGGGTNYFAGQDSARGDVVAGGFIGHYINKAAGGVPVPIQVHPNLTPGTLIAVSDSLPFPNSNVSNVFELRNLREVADYSYGVNRNAGVAGGGPRFDGEVYSFSTLVNKAPISCGVIQDISAS